MANVVICDRCNQLGMRLALGAMALRTDLDEDTKARQLEMCPDCVAELVTWIDTPPKDRAGSGVPFTEPYTPPEPAYPAAAAAIEAAPAPARRGRPPRMK